MCTVTWLHTPTGFELFSNRDESLARGPELPPQVATIGDVQVLAPRDSDAGGTWIAVNEYGVALTLLNGYRRDESSDPGADAISRGLLVSRLSSSRSIDTLRRRLEGTELRRYRSFVLLALEARRPALVVDWDGVSLSVDADADERRPLVSSSFEPTRVRAARTARYREITADRAPVDGEAFAAFHASHADGPGPLSVCMHRSDAATRSFTRMRVGARNVDVAYQAAPPCEESAVVRMSLLRRSAVEASDDAEV